jgi:[protein-PII] uridylyltransferase
MSEVILRRLGLPEEEVEDTCQLVRNHLTMYLIAARRDLGDPATLAEFVHCVRDRDGLRDLYLLTVADLSTTSAVALTKWKASMLTGLYRAADAFLSGPGGTVTSRSATRREQVVKLWEDPEEREALTQFLDSMPERYFLSNTPAQICAHASLAIAPRSAPVGLSLVPSEHDGVMGLCVVTKGGEPGTGLCVVAGDRPGLLAAISAAIYASYLRIESAQINSRPLPNGDRQAVDLFWVRGLNDQDPSDDVLEKLQRDLTAVVAGHIPATHFVRAHRPSRIWEDRRLPPVSTQVTFDYHGSADQTIIEIMTEDRPALLFTLADALHSVGVSISVAKICTEGKRAVDVFYATEMDGSKLQPGPRSEEIRRHVIEVLGVASA